MAKRSPRRFPNLMCGPAWCSNVMGALRWKRAKTHRGSRRRRCPAASRSRIYVSSCDHRSQSSRLLQSGGVHIRPHMTLANRFSRRRGRIVNGPAFRMFSHVDPVPGVVVRRARSTSPLEADSVGQGLGPGRIYEYVNLDRRQSSSAIGRGSMLDPGPPRGFIAISVQIAMMQPADRDCVFVADLSA